MMLNRRTPILVASLLLLAAMPGVLTAGCGDTIVFDCNYPIVDRLSEDGQRDPCCHIDACPGHCLEDPCPDGGTDDAGTDATNSCAGTCVPLGPVGGWEGPYVLWTGPEGTAPECLKYQLAVIYQGYDDLNAPPASCGACSCSSSSGSCAPPLSLATSSKSCGGGPGMITPFDGPSGWDGSCTAKDCIGPAPTCAHPMSVQSLAVDPLVVTEQGCKPSTAMAPDPSAPTWTTSLLACRGAFTSGFGCKNPGETCVSFVAPPDFRMCLFHTSDMSCPDSYPDKHLVYTGFDDQRACSACACGAPVGNGCTASLNVFKDGACSMPLLTGSVSSSAAACFDLVPAGLPLGSKTVTNLAYQPGSCVPSGGEPSGAVEPSGPATFCCLKN